MKQSARISMFVSTVVVTVGIFAVVWLTRPAANNEIVELARARQSQPLMEVDEPARLQKTADQENQKLVDELYPYISKKILSDPAVNDHIVALFNDNLQTQMKQTIEPKVNELIQEQLTSTKGKMTDQMATLTGEGVSTEEAEKIIRREVDDYVPQVIDGMIPQIVQLLVDAFDAEQDTYAPALQKILEPYQAINEEQAVALYKKYYNDIIVDLVPIILDNVEAEIMPILDNFSIIDGVIPKTVIKSNGISIPYAPSSVKATVVSMTDYNEKKATPAVPPTPATPVAQTTVEETTAPAAEVAMTPSAPETPVATTTEQPMAEETTTEEPMAEETMTEETMTEETAPSEEPVAEEATTEATAEPVTEEVATEATTEAPAEVTAEPVAAEEAAPEVPAAPKVPSAPSTLKSTTKVMVVSVPGSPAVTVKSVYMPEQVKDESILAVPTTTETTKTTTSEAENRKQQILQALYDLQQTK